MGQVKGFGVTPEQKSTYYLMVIEQEGRRKGIPYEYNCDVLTEDLKEEIKGILISNFISSLKSCLDFVNNLLKAENIVIEVKVVKDLRNAYTDEFDVMVPYCTQIPTSVGSTEKFKIRLPFKLKCIRDKTEQQQYLLNIKTKVEELLEKSTDEMLKELGYCFEPTHNPNSTFEFKEFEVGDGITVTQEDYDFLMSEILESASTYWSEFYKTETAQLSTPTESVAEVVARGGKVVLIDTHSDTEILEQWTIDYDSLRTGIEKFFEKEQKMIKDYSIESITDMDDYGADKIARYACGIED